MSPQEREILGRFLNQLRDTRLPAKNPEAEALINAAVAGQPDAAYWLVQRAVVAEQALEAVNAQNAQLRAQIQAMRASGGQTVAAPHFLGDNNPWLPAASPAAPAPGAAAYQPTRAGAASPTTNGVSGFLGNVATTAAGVAAGSFLFQGIESLFGHHAAGASWLGNAMPNPVAEETVINNYYGSGTDPNWTMANGGSDAMADYAGDNGADGDETWL